MTGTFSVKNFDRFQHYRDRKPVWIKLYNELLDDYEFGLLPDASKMHLVAIWLLASRYENAVPADPAWVARRINATEPVNLDILAERGFIQYNQECSDVLAERYQPASLEKETETEKDSSFIARARDLPDDLPAVLPPLDANGRSGLDAEFDQFMAAYPEKVGRRQARIAFPDARRKSDLQTILDGIDHYVRSKPPDRQWMSPATFLADERWTDRYAERPASTNTTRRPESGTDAMGRALARIVAERRAARGEGDGYPGEPFTDGRPAERDDGGGVVIDLAAIGAPGVRG